MTKLEALAKECIENHTHRLVDKPTKQDIYLREESIFIQGYRQSEKRITELEEKISILLSCKNCSENKGGFICQKEYEDKCLAQKIQYIKELQQENAELNEQLRFAKEMPYSAVKKFAEEKTQRQLTKAKAIINIAIEGIKYWGIVGGTERPFEKQAEKLFNLFLDKAEQFLKE